MACGNRMALRTMILAAVVGLLGGCATAVMKPSESHLRTDTPPQAGQIPPPVQIPTLLPKPKPAIRPETYSVVVNNVKVQDLLFALARDAKVNVDIHPGITGVITVNAIDQTLPQLLSRIAKQVDMRWELDGPNLVVMPDTPYLRVYKIDYLNMERTSTVSVGASGLVTAVGGSGGGGGGGGGGSNTSNVKVDNTTKNTFWVTLEKNIKDLLHETDKIIPSGAAAAAAVAAPPAAAGQPPAGQPPSAQPGAAPATQPSAPNLLFREAASVIINAESGVVVIRATSRQHEKIQEFLDQVMASAKRQVLIEVTVVEVQLNNQYQQGIDWSMFGDTLRLSSSAAGLPSAPSLPNIFTVTATAFNIGNLSAIVRLLDSFGTARVLSSPRLSVLNNQTALLRVVDNLIYFQVQATVTGATQTSPALTSFNTTPNTVPIGFVMNVTPQISDNDTILLNVKPTISRFFGFVSDPNPSLGAIPNLVPQIRLREIESLIKVNSGQIAVLGGLIQDSATDSEDTIPGVNRVPLFGSIFSSRNRLNVKTELVIFIRPLVVKDASIDGDFRAFRTTLPAEDFLMQPNPGKPPADANPFAR